MSDNIIREIKSFKTQLDQHLSKRFIDPTLLLGLSTVVEGKFENWIIADFNEYYTSVEVNKPSDFNTIKYFETLWSNFHYPIIKYFQKVHQAIYNDILKEFNDSKDNFKLHPVEMRKINDPFIRFINKTSSFYKNLLEYFSTHFKNPLIPNKFLAYFDFKISKNSIPTSNSNLQANILYLIYKNLLCLGDCSRHRSFIETSYVLPSLNKKNFHKFRLLNNEKKYTTFKSYYELSFTYYKFCILLLPSLNEPYNHIGMINNLIENKFDSVYWFLRSCFTRLPSNKLGISNLNNLLNKNWFKTNLYEILVSNNINDFTKNFHNQLFKKSNDLNVMLTCLIGFHYSSNYNLNNHFIMKKLNYNKVEFIFLNLNFNDDLFLSLMNLDEGGNFYLKQLIVLISFNKMITKAKFQRLLKKYFEYFFQAIIKVLKKEITPSDLNNILVCLRLSLNWFKEDNYQLDQKLIESLVEILNLLLKSLKEDVDKDVSNVSEDQIPNNSKYLQMIETLKGISRPVRSYYFADDVILKDFSIIKYQFKDFKDNHLFESNDINLLNNDYSSLIVNKFPIFLDNESFLKMTDFNQEFINEEILNNENHLRLQALLILGKKLLLDSPCKIEFSSEFKVTQPIKRKRIKNRRKIKKKPQEKVEDVNTQILSNEEESEDSDSDLDDFEDEDIDEIQNFILHHSNKLKDEIKQTIASEASSPIIQPRVVMGDSFGDEGVGFAKEVSSEFKKEGSSFAKEDSVVSQMSNPSINLMSGQPFHPQAQLPTQSSIQMQIPGQIPGQIQGQMPGQMPTQIPGQLPGQMPTQIPAQIPAQLPSQIPHLQPNQFHPYPQYQPPMYPYLAGSTPYYQSPIPSQPYAYPPFPGQPSPQPNTMPNPPPSSTQPGHNSYPQFYSQ
ncbi:hypothetical protein CLIB1444_11S03114 [[Candida] jaroonii]|uniref:Uncharacterized protein n=1 Tax=[Candida] jaroonii TaxID=467808 RepID=A0ACA9YDE0_9ASCO|nr:hypothetical protein CLIB1444_11S03114 [[Candida] jaroonii]